MHKDEMPTARADKRNAERVFAKGAWDNIAGTEEFLYSSDPKMYNSKMWQVFRLYPGLLQQDVLSVYEHRMLRCGGTLQEFEELGETFGRLLYLRTFSTNRQQVPEDLRPAFEHYLKAVIEGEFEAVWCSLTNCSS